MFVGGAIAIAVLVWTYGCQSQVRSITNPMIVVNRGELRIEVDNFLAQAELKFADLDRQDQFKSTLFDTAITFMEGGKINPLAVAFTIGNILGLGAVVDNVKKRTHINTLKSNAAAS